MVWRLSKLVEGSIEYSSDLELVPHKGQTH
jgi:hypothetical protein